MNKKIYVAPQTDVCMIEGQELLNSISNPTSTNVEGLGVSTDSYVDEGHVKSSDYNVWDDDWSK